MVKKEESHDLSPQPKVSNSRKKGVLVVTGVTANTPRNSVVL